MTLAPAENWHEVVGADGHPLEPNLICSHPMCNRPSTDGHHIWRRSLTGGPKDWVYIEGRLVANKTWLCVEHHAEVTGGIGGHKAWIRWHEGQYWWYDSEPGPGFDWVCRGAITPQPRGAAGTLESLDDVPAIEAPIPDHICPQCGKVHRHKHKKPKDPGPELTPEELERLPARKRTRIQVTVPQDEQENGADVIFALLEDPELQRRLGTLHFNEKDRNYHTLTRGLYALHQLGDRISFGQEEGA